MKTLRLCNRLILFVTKDFYWFGFGLVPDKYRYNVVGHVTLFKLELGFEYVLKRKE